MSETKTKVTLDDFAKVVLGCIQEINVRLNTIEARLNTIEMNLGLGDYQEE